MWYNMYKRCCCLEASNGFLLVILETTVDAVWLVMTFYNCHCLLLFMTAVINNYGLMIVSSNRRVRKAF